MSYTKTATGYGYKASDSSQQREAINSTFSYAKDGEEIKTAGFPNWDAMVAKKGMDFKTAVQLKHKGEVVGSVARVLQPGGMIITVSGKLTLPDGQNASYNNVYDRK